MTQDEIQPGVRFTNLSGAYAGTVSRVTRRRGRLRKFWAKWDHDASGEAEHQPEDAEYLIREKDEHGC